MTLCKSELLSLVQTAPTGTATPERLTGKILHCVRQLEVKSSSLSSSSSHGSSRSGSSSSSRSTATAAAQLQQLQGTWELVWTAQDPAAPESKRNWIINPLENQSYSNNPMPTTTTTTGRANPLLPLAWQEALERTGWISSTTSTSGGGAVLRSTQTIDIRQGRIRNIVALNLGKSNSGRRASIVVDLLARPDIFNPCRINVKFDHCRVILPPHLDWDFSLTTWFGGPIGWIHNVYLDDDLRITRGHKGSVFVLTRPRRAAV